MISAHFSGLFVHDLVAFIPDLFLLVAILILLVVGSSISLKSVHEKTVWASTILWLSFWTLILTLVLMKETPFSHAILFNHALLLDPLSFVLKVSILGTCLLLLSLAVNKPESHSFEFPLLFLLSAWGMGLMAESYDLISMYLSIELQSFCFFLLAASRRNSEFSTEAGLKYFLLGAFSSGLFLFGSSFIYGFTGQTSLEELAKATESLFALESVYNNESNGLIIGILFLSAGFLFKSGAAPFHMWTPDVYEGSPTTVTALFSILPKIALFGMFLRFFFQGLSSLFIQWQTLFFFSSLLSMIVGITAISQTKLKRLFAYSSIGHVGYFLIGFAVANPQGVQSLLFALGIYIVMTLHIFTFLLAAAPENRKYCADLTSFAKINPVVALSLALILFSMAGIPPLAGFLSKFYLFRIALASQFTSLAILGVITSVITSYYYIRLVRIMYFGKPLEYNTMFSPIPKQHSLILGITLFFVLFLFLYQSPLLTLTYQISFALSS
uniref:NADH dehydrogenase subunit 2 n=1 Tax=Mesostigma viride TaxID=41882 RepID=Q8W9S7_MESVI|nr:NADH dehydrogenase subunit 2 [Mesostigma viride]AAL36732.1 NADH dehydrogenase subunit 2 [Mesostigma viride]